MVDKTVGETSTLKTVSLYERIYAVIRQIPSGKVTTYGQVATVVGGKCGPRTVGYALSSLPFGSDVPWQRVVNRQGKVSPRDGGLGSINQQDVLEAEGVEFDPQTRRIDFDQFGWHGPDWDWLDTHGFNPLPILDNL